MGAVWTVTPTDDLSLRCVERDPSRQFNLLAVSTEVVLFFQGPRAFVQESLQVVGKIPLKWPANRGRRAGRGRSFSRYFALTRNFSPRKDLEPLAIPRRIAIILAFSSEGSSD